MRVLANIFVVVLQRPDQGNNGPGITYFSQSNCGKLPNMRITSDQCFTQRLDGPADQS